MLDFSGQKLYYIFSIFRQTNHNFNELERIEGEY